LIIERVQIEEGFLNGLDLTFEPGLNVLIGPRGCGKTSIIEIIRFCLDVPTFTEKTSSIARQHALSILESGQVTVTLRLGTERIHVTRTREDESSRSSSDYSMPIILSQNEIEAVGLEAKGRLKIIDGFKTPDFERDLDELSLLTRIGSLTVEMQDLSKEIDSIRQQIETLNSVPALLADTEKEEASVLKSLDKTKPEQDRLNNLVKASTANSIRASIFERTRLSLINWKTKLSDLSTVRLEKWPESAGAPDLLETARKHTLTSVQHLQKAIEGTSLALDNIANLIKNNADERFKCDEEARGLRQKLESIKQGAGSVTRRVAELREKVGQLSANNDLLKDKFSVLSSTQSERGSLLRELEKIRDKRYKERSQVVAALNKELGPRIKVKLERSGLHSEYVSAIAGTLRGSRLHYHTLAPLLASKMSPQELVEAIENGNAELLSELGEITQDRARNLIAHVRMQGVQDLITAPVEDAVQLSLLDGNEYKDTEYLSTGQRCTVVLPLLLSRRDEVLIVDQPEDHLDNAFIVDTLIQAILKGNNDTQRIFSTHNANIPVLGDAKRVILLGSDGKRGFVRHAGALDEKESIKAITTVMEGGIEAFRKRAEFYQTRQVSRDG
jgi:energy-coupling factor transporter ATP-binding protein EcfA2